MMAGIRCKDTKPEIIVRKGLHRKGFRYLTNDKRLPGKPDLVLPKFNAAVFVHGCFWHGHDCNLFKIPSSRTDFWLAKIDANRRNDVKAITGLEEKGWRVGVVWECALKGKGRLAHDDLIDLLAGWLKSPDQAFGLRGTI